MATVRVTQGLLIDRSIQNLRDTTLELLRTQEQLASGRRVVRISDDPLNARLGISAQAQIQQNNQFIDNINNASPPVNETGTNIQNLLDALQRVKELSLQAANGTLSQDQQTAVSQEIDELLEQVFAIGNHLTNNRYIFAGTRTGDPAFSATRNAQNEITSVTYEGNDESIFSDVSETISLRINETGTDIFNPAGGTDIFQMLIDIRDDMRAGNQGNLQTVRQAEIDDSINQLLSSVARNGSISNRLERVRNDTEDINIELQATYSNAIDADYAETIIALNAQSNAYQAALNATSRVIQPSLLDFLR